MSEISRDVLSPLVRSLAGGQDPRACIAPAVTTETTVDRLLEALCRAVGSISDQTAKQRIAKNLFRSYPNVGSCIDLYCHVFASQLDDEALIELRMRSANLLTNDPQAILRLATAYERARRASDAIGVLEAAQDFGVADEYLIFKLGYYLALESRHAEAINQYQSALKKKVTHRTLLNLAASYRQQAELMKSRAASTRAIILEPGSADAYYNLGNLERELGNTGISVRRMLCAEYVAPNNYSIKWNLSNALLADGQFETGFKKYKERWFYDGFPTKPRFKNIRNIDSIDGKSGKILFYSEQGKGDNILFFRFIEEFVKSDNNQLQPTFEIPPELFNLFSNSLPSENFILYRTPLPGGFDYYYPLFDIPLLIGKKSVNTCEFPYLRASANAAVPQLTGPSPKVGIVWAGNPGFVHDRSRSARLDDLTSLLDDPDIHFFSLQKGTDEGHVSDRYSNVVDLAPDLQTFDDTAAAMEELDFIVTTCTATANLAGALGKKGFVLVSHVRDWRWMSGPQSDWYPSLKILEKPRSETWSDFFASVRRELRAELGVS